MKEDHARSLAFQPSLACQLAHSFAGLVITTNLRVMNQQEHDIITAAIETNERTNERTERASDRAEVGIELRNETKQKRAHKINK